jgi:hypothetical protein
MENGNDESTLDLVSQEESAFRIDALLGLESMRMDASDCPTCEWCVIQGEGNVHVTILLHIFCITSSI